MEENFLKHLKIGVPAEEAQEAEDGEAERRAMDDLLLGGHAEEGTWGGSATEGERIARGRSQHIAKGLADYKRSRGRSASPTTRSTLIGVYDASYDRLLAHEGRQRAMGDVYEGITGLVRGEIDHMRTDHTGAAMDYTPVVGGARAAKETMDAYSRGEIGKGGAAIGIGLAVAGEIPGLKGATKGVNKKIFQAMKHRMGTTATQQSVRARLFGTDSVAAFRADRVRPINGRMPINSEYAGKVYFDKLPKDLQLKYPHGVPFTGTGHPDFSRYAVKKVEIKMTGNRPIDDRLANQAAGFTKKPDGFTWHHHEDGKTMFLVPRDLHAEIDHTGGAAVLKGKKK